MAQMIMLVDSHPDIIEFIISKIQNPRILQFIKNNTKDSQIKRLIEEKLKFTALSAVEEFTLKNTVNSIDQTELRGVTLTDAESNARKYAKEKLEEGGNWSVNNPDFLTGANISVCLTHEFMTALEKDGEYALRFPDLENYNEQEMKDYNEKWHTIGDVREWEKLGYAIKTYRKIKAKELWNLINIAATYSAEPGIFFIDNANDMTNAVSYGQKVVATNPCGEQPLAPYSVCNLAAVNLANFVNKETKEFNFEELKNTVRVGVRMQDNVIDSTPYFLEENTKQALGERRVGLKIA